MTKTKRRTRAEQEDPSPQASLTKGQRRAVKAAAKVLGTLLEKAAKGDVTARYRVGVEAKKIADKYGPAGIEIVAEIHRKSRSSIYSFISVVDMVTPAELRSIMSRSKGRLEWSHLILLSNKKRLNETRRAALLARIVNEGLTPSALRRELFPATAEWGMADAEEVLADASLTSIEVDDTVEEVTDDDVVEVVDEDDDSDNQAFEEDDDDSVDASDEQSLDARHVAVPPPYAERLRTASESVAEVELRFQTFSDLVDGLTGLNEPEITPEVMTQLAANFVLIQRLQEQLSHLMQKGEMAHRALQQRFAARAHLVPSPEEVTHQVADATHAAGSYPLGYRRLDLSDDSSLEGA